MAMEPRPSRSPTLRVMDLLSTRVQSVRIELVGSEGGVFARMGAVLVYLPLVLIGYLLILAALMKVIAAGIGWGLTFFVFGAIHLAVSAWGISRGPALGASKTYDVVDPDVAAPQRVGPPAAPQRSANRAGTSDTLPDVRAAAAAERPGSGVAPPMSVTPPPPVTVIPHPLQNLSRPPGLRGSEGAPGRPSTAPGRSATGTPGPAASAPSDPK